MRKRYVALALLLAAGLACCLSLALGLVTASPAGAEPTTPTVAVFVPLVMRDASFPTPTPTPPPVPPPGGPVTFTQGTVNIPSYPFSRFLTPVVDPAMRNYPVLTLDRNAYQNSYPAPTPATFTLLVLENRYLRLTLLPELGGRVYECIFKPTGENLLYRNPVLKPSHWGPVNGPAGANWWLAAGGIEWGFPVEEHGYEWATPWNWQQGLLPDGSRVITLSAPTAGRPAYPAVSIRLAPDTAAFTIAPQITNTLGSPFLFKWWINAMIAPGGQNHAGADLRFLFPVSEVTIHSNGDETLPHHKGDVMSWPVYGGRDMSRLGNWNQWLGFFERPAAQKDWAGMYDTAERAGLLRVFPSAVARGAKGFGLGWGPNAIMSSEYTDGDSSYVELHGGTAPTFDDWTTLPAGGTLAWEETWYPVAGLTGQPIAATAAGALSMARSDTGADVELYLPRPAGPVTVTLAAGSYTTTIPVPIIAPDFPFRGRLSWPAGAVPQGMPVSVVVTDAADAEVYRYEG